MTDIVAELRGLMPLVLTSVRVTLGIAAAEIERLRKTSAGPQVSPWQPIARHLEDFALWLELNGHTVDGHLGRPTSDLHYKCDACRRLTGARKALAALPAPPSVEAIERRETETP